MQKRILIYNSGGGLGDSIQLFSLIISLKNHFKGSDIYFLSAHENHFINKLKEYEIKLLSLDLGLKYFGFRWWHWLFTKIKFKNLKQDQFDLIIDLQSKIRNTIILKKIPHKEFYSATFNFSLCSKQNDYLFSHDLNEMTLKNLSLFLKEDIKKITYEINNLSDKLKNEAKRLLPNDGYIGFSITQGNKYRKKSWPIDNFISLAKSVEKNNKIPVFFIEKKNINLKNKISKLIPDAIFPEHESNLSSAALVVCLGNYTRLNRWLSHADKEYNATLCLGATSVTGDAQGPIAESSGYTIPDASIVAEKLRGFCGEIEQVPHAYSAIKVDGVRSYKKARRGEKVELKARRINIYQLELVSYEFPKLVIRVHCSSGTYIRSLAADLGASLGVGAYLAELQRIARCVRPWFAFKKRVYDHCHATQTTTIVARCFTLQLHSGMSESESE